MASDKLTIKGARVHNLRNISLTLPRNKLVVITGLSGSGKSTGGRLNAFANMLEASGDLIEAGFIGDACGQLRSALRRVDGEPRPPDFATGVGAELIAAQIEFLRTSLGCE